MIESLRRRFGAMSTLGIRIALPAGFFTLVSVALLSYLLVREQRDQVLREVVHGSENVAKAILLSLDQDMRLNQREGVEELIGSFGRHEDIESIRIYNKDGTITFSSRAAEVGRRVSTKSQACAYCHGRKLRTIKDLKEDNRSRIIKKANGERVLASIHVIPNAEGCDGSDCHALPSEQSVLGVMDVGMSLRKSDARLAAASRNALMLSVLAAGIITLIMFLMIRQGVRKPLLHLSALTRKIAAGGAGEFVPESSAREITYLSRSFNEMIESLGSSKQQLETWARALEQQVAAEAEQVRQAQYQVIQAEKLSSVGLVAAGIAHELNSPLMAIITFSHLVRSTLPADSPAHEDLRTIEREANRCAVIIRQLLDYARKQSQEPETRPCNLRQIIQGNLDLLKIELQNAGVEVHVDIDDDLPEVEANDQQLMQVFMNLMLNALQAMPEGGELFVSGNTVERKFYEHLDLPPHSSSQLVRIVVRDTGTGITRQNLPRVFDPFFTTKPVGKGSGLGLSVSLGLVQRYHGTIRVDSDGASWTEFTVLLPPCKQPALVSV
ncbi:MAG TPA: ATP-binding protein [Longimicrobiales bacterium]|nr:ATP-binding protein [Longimicrobiales bacterium]